MIMAIVSVCAGWLLGLILVALAAATLPAFVTRRLAAMIAYTASGALMGGLWLSYASGLAQHQEAGLGSLFLCGILLAPVCALPVMRRIAGSIEGLVRAASGLGASPYQRMVLLWLPLLRVPLLLSTGISIAVVLLCVCLSGYGHG